jgi:hypothetical protein
MFARVTVFEGGDAEALRGAAKEINESDGPPPNIPAKGITMLTDPATGKSLTITFFETEEDRDKGHAALNEMSPTGNAGERASVDFYEVAVDRRL